MSTSKVLGKDAEKLSEKNVLIVGVGGLGCTVANLLARLGINLTLIDYDVVRPSNLERQILFDKDDLSKKKVVVAKNKLEQFTNIKIIDDNITERNIGKIISKDKNIDLVIDCTDNVKTRLLLNRYCKKNKMNWMYSAAVKDVGAIYFIDNKNDGPCYECIQQEKEGEIACDVGVLNSLVVMVASMTVNIAVNYLVNGKIEDKLLRINMNDSSIMKIKINRKCYMCKARQS
ncbi:MAG: ThiF family adenylyltransferase [Candidatus Woesearchaeota archaeon]